MACDHVFTATRTCNGRRSESRAGQLNELTALASTQNALENRDDRLLQAHEHTHVSTASSNSISRCELRRFLDVQGCDYYIRRDLTRKLSSGKEDVRHADLCAAKLRLDRVVAREPAGAIADNQKVTLTYNYRIDPAPWAREDAARKVFPMVARMIDGERNL